MRIDDVTPGDLYRVEHYDHVPYVAVGIGERTPIGERHPRRLVTLALAKDDGSPNYDAPPVEVTAGHLTPWGPWWEVNGSWVERQRAARAAGRRLVEVIDRLFHDDAQGEVAYGQDPYAGELVSLRLPLDVAEALADVLDDARDALPPPSLGRERADG